MENNRMNLWDSFKKNSLSGYYRLYQKFNPKTFIYWFKYSDKLENFGDIAGPIIFSRLSGKKVYDPLAFAPNHLKYIQHYLTVGSIFSVATKRSTVWGSGIIRSDENIKGVGRIHAVRGPLTRDRLLACGFNCPEIYGDPAVLLPLLYPVKSQAKTFKKTIIPHYVDQNLVDEMVQNDTDYRTVNLLTTNFEQTLSAITSSNLVISSSLHGIIVAAAYNIPFIWVKFSDNLVGDNIKFLDFFQSIDCPLQSPVIVNDFKTLDCLSLENAFNGLGEKITALQLNLLQSFPEKINNQAILKFLESAA